MSKASGKNSAAGGVGSPLAELRARLEPIVTEAVTGAGFDLDSFEVANAGRKRQVKVVVDHDNGVGLDEVAEVSRALSNVLDQKEHVLEGSYTLEVTSPGTDRPLTTVRHWRRAQARQVKARFADGKHALVRVGRAGDREVRLLFDAKHARPVPYTDIEKAVVEVEFRPPPKAELELLDLPTTNEEESK